MPLDLVCVRSFVEVVERGTVAAAADALGYTAPAVSQHIARLSADVGAALFDRRAGRLVPTAAATALAPIAHELLDVELRARAAVAQPVPIMQLTIAGFATAITTVVIPALARLDPGTDVRIVEAEDEVALRDLGLGAVDIALVQEYDHAPIERNRRFVYAPIVADPLTLVLPAHRSDRTTLARVAAEPWLLNGASTRCATATLHLLAAAGITPRIVATVEDNQALIALVAAGRGVTIVPSQVAIPHRQSVTIARAPLDVSRHIYAVTRRAMADTLGPAVAALAAAGA